MPPVNTIESFPDSLFKKKPLKAIARSIANKITPNQLSGVKVFHYSIPNVQLHEDGAWEDGETIDSDKWLLSTECVLISKLNPRKSTLCLATPHGDYSVFSTEFVPLSTATHADNKYLLYTLSTPSMTGYLSSLATSVTRSHQRVHPNDIMRTPIPWPERVTRKRIADYLDHETAEIDQFLSLHERFRGLLVERRNNVVKSRVTRGLSSGEKLVASRDPAIGYFPARWRETRLKFIGESIIGVTYSPEDLVDESNDGVNVLRSGNIQNGRMVSTNMVRISKSIPDKLRIRENDILLCARNGSAELVGKNALATPEFHGDTWGAFMVVFRSPHSRFLSWFFNTDTFRSRVGGFSTTTINQLTSKDLGNSLVTLPSKTEQAQISDLLDRETIAIDGLIADSASATTLARERRAALITAAVTGQIDVTARHKPAAEQLEDDIAQGLHREN